MKIAFIGAVEFSECCLEGLITSGADVVGVITRGRRAFISDWADISALASRNSIPVIYAHEDDEVSENLEALAPDIVFCIGWSKLIPPELLNRWNFIGYHPTVLPANRGRHPIIWSIALGLKEGGSTFFKMVEEADAGPIVSSSRFPIPEGADCRWYYYEIKKIAAKQIPDMLALIERTGNAGIEQNGETNTWRKRTLSDSLIDFRMSAESIVRLVKALQPIYPGPYIIRAGFGNLQVTRLKQSQSAISNFEPGRINRITQSEMSVSCGDGEVTLSVKTPAVINHLKVGDYI